MQTDGASRILSDYAHVILRPATSDMASLIQRYAGALLALLASLIFSLMNAQAQTCMRHGVSPGQVAFGRMVRWLTTPL